MKKLFEDFFGVLSDFFINITIKMFLVFLLFGALIISPVVLNTIGTYHLITGERLSSHLIAWMSVSVGTLLVFLIIGLVNDVDLFKSLLFFTGFVCLIDFFIVSTILFSLSFTGWAILFFLLIDLILILMRNDNKSVLKKIIFGIIIVIQIGSFIVIVCASDIRNGEAILGVFLYVILIIDIAIFIWKEKHYKRKEQEWLVH